MLYSLSLRFCSGPHIATNTNQIFERSGIQLYADKPETKVEDAFFVSCVVSVQYPVISRRFIAEKSVLSTQKGTDFSLRSK